MSNSDWWLDPPDEPLCSDCDECGSEFPTEELIQIKTNRWLEKWLCPDCLEENNERNKEP